MNYFHVKLLEKTHLGNVEFAYSAFDDIQLTALIRKQIRKVDAFDQISP